MGDTYFIENMPSVAADGEFIRVTFTSGRSLIFRPSVFQSHIDACQRALDDWFIEASHHRAVRLPPRKHLRSNPASALDERNVRVKRSGGDPPD